MTDTPSPIQLPSEPPTTGGQPVPDQTVPGTESGSSQEPFVDYSETPGGVMIDLYRAADPIPPEETIVLP